MADRSEPLLGGRRRSRARQFLDIAGDVHGLHSHNRRHAVSLAPGQKLPHRLRVSAAGIAIADVGREEFEETKLRALAGGGDEGGGGVDRTEGGELVHAVNALAGSNGTFA
jgi:hypothetical protein